PRYRGGVRFLVGPCLTVSGCATGSPPALRSALSTGDRPVDSPGPRTVNDERPSGAPVSHATIFDSRRPGRIEGKATDSKNEVLRGVTVVVSGPAIQGTKASIT